MVTPATAVMRRATPAIKATPRHSMPTMNSQSTKAEPAMPRCMSAKTPSVPNFRKPVVGEPPLIHALSDSVAKPRPKVLSRKVHRKIQPRQIRRPARA
jgi:hypothetical protein